MEPDNLTVTLRYAKPKTCICTPTATDTVVSLCPEHGNIDRLSNEPSAPRRNQPRVIKKRTRDDEDSDFVPSTQRRKRNPAPRSRKLPTISPRPHAPPRIPRSIQPRVKNTLNTEMATMRDKVDHQLNIEDVSDGDSTLPDPPSEPASLTQIDFLSSSLEVRKIIYRYLLVPSSKTIVFPSSGQRHAFGDANPELQAGIVVANRQVYKEARSILYGENKFVAEHPTRFFFPTGIQGLRARTTSMIKHLSLERSGSAASLCMESCETIVLPIWRMMTMCPAFMSLKKLTIRRQVTRPADLDFFGLQTLTISQGKEVNGTRLYRKKDLTMQVVGTLAYRAAMRNSAFYGVVVVEDGDHEVSTPAGRMINNVIEICLVRSPGVELDEIAQHEAKGELQKAILDVLWEDKEAEVHGASERFEHFVRNYAT